MKLYYTPGACSLSPHIVLREAGIEFDLEKVDLETRKTETGADFVTVNAKGYVPALGLGDGETLTEGAAIVQYLADQVPGKNLIPASGTLARARVQEHLTFISSELHKAFSPLFKSDSTDIEKDKARTKVAQRLAEIDAWLADGRIFLTGDTFTIADAYLFTIANWTGPTGMNITDWPNVAAYMDRVKSRPAVQDALKAEGLI